MNKLLIGAAAGVAGIALVFWILTIPATVPASELPPYTPNVGNGRTVFYVAGCASCHATPNSDAKKIDYTRLGGGLALPSPFGTFFVPNISPDPGRWNRRVERSGLRHRALEGDFAKRPASVSGISLHLIPAHDAY
jgi:hypothetical protein